jgi:predicted dehydrogenase
MGFRSSAWPRLVKSARQKAADLGIPRCYGSLDELLLDPDIDVVHLAHRTTSITPPWQP